MSEVVKKAWNIYMLQLQLHPLRTKVITSGVLAGFQDLHSQKSSGIKKLQLRRLLLLMLYGFAYGGPFDYCCQKLTDFIFKGKNDIKTYAKKVLLQQLTYHPWNNLLYMVYYGLLVEGRPWRSVKNKVRKEYPALQLDAWKVRVMFSTVYGSCWGIYLNFKSRSSAAKKD
ncbi:hypothetical protein HYC85_012675 [Camellia sinensis]|uniref:Peroxisomal membrane protein PMP22 n=1 Tax=Camellia sinensis TaxID=4442 RepID=A0A7J7HCL1_CAMSI|nr:hypothetical protein HYC85_012675 [Camellia sinensis]